MFSLYLTKEGIRNLIKNPVNTNPNSLGHRCSKPINGLEQFWDKLSQKCIKKLSSFYEPNPHHLIEDYSSNHPYMDDYIFEFDNEEDALYFKLKFKDDYVSNQSIWV